MIYNIMTTRGMNRMLEQGENITATYCYNGECVINTKEFSESIIKDTIREFIISQHLHTFGAPPPKEVLGDYVSGFILFNLHKNKYMLKSKDELLKYINNSSISLEEKRYFENIFLYNQRPSFLTSDELEYIRACGTLDGYNEYHQNEDEDDYDTISVLFNRLENTVSVLSNKYSALIA
jgi:hypothetical protein